MGKLDETSNLLALYAHHVGKSNTPQEFHLWAALAGIAACVADRVGLEVIPGRPLAPNLYVMLIGPSAAGKGMAINKIAEYIEKTPCVAPLIGKVSGMGVIDYLAEQSTLTERASSPDHVDKTKLFLGMAELSFSIGEGPVADQFIKTMTELYDSTGTHFYERTRTGGTHKFKKPNITWLAGTTMEWLMTSITGDQIMSGFFGRTCAVISQGVKHQLIAPVLPPDYQEVAQHIQERFIRLSHLRGVFTRTHRAHEVEKAWFYGLQPNGQPGMEPFEGRQHMLSLKLAMLLSLADGENLVIDAHHMAMAQTLVDKLRVTLPKLIDYAFSLGDVKPTRVVENLLQRAGEMPKYMLVNKARRLGIPAYRLEEALNTLVQEKLIEKFTVSPKAHAPQVAYRRVKRDIFAQILKDVPPEDDETEEAADEYGNNQ